MKPFKSFLIAIGLIALASGCKQIDLPQDTPNCVKSLIKKHDVLAVWKWEVDGSTFYYTAIDCCDQFNVLYNTDCEEVCAPDGGFSGQGDGNCPQWTEDPVKTLIWEAE